MVKRIKSEKMEAFPLNDGLEGMIIPVIDTVTDKGKPFFVHDNQDGKTRFLILITTKISDF